jgi:CBS domain containing-hemolysin-like protein
MFKGDTLDAVANGISWVVLVVVPIVVIAVFWLVHILPEKIAEQRRHPQAPAIKTLCLLSLFFGGMLWPLAWLWAYSKPVLYKLAYGTDVADEHHGQAPEAPVAVAVAGEETRGEDELAELRRRLASLESRLNPEERR